MNAGKTLSLTLIALLLMGTLLTLYPAEALPNQDKLFDIVGVVATSTAGLTRIYPGSRRVNLRIEAMYNGDGTAYSIVGHLEIPESLTGYISFSAGSGPSTPARSLNGSIPLKVERGDHVLFEYYLDISKTLEPGTYYLNFNITYRLDSEGEVRCERHENKVYINIYNYPDAKIRFIEAYLNPVSYPGSVDTNLYVILENSGETSITSADFRVELPQGFIVKNPRASVGVVNAGERFTIRFSGVWVPQGASTGIYNATIQADLSMRTEDNVYYSSTASLNIQFEVAEPPEENPIMVSSVFVLYRESPAPLLPSSRGVTIRVTLINRLPENVGGMVVLLDSISGISVRSISGTYVNGMLPGGSCFIDITVDVNEEVDIGLVTIPIEISYVRVVSGSSFIGKQGVNISVVVESPHAYISEIELVSAYWGYPNPSPVYSGSRYVPLTLRFMNRGRYDIVGVAVKASSRYLRPIKDSEALAIRLVPGAYSEVTLYFDIITAGRVPLNVQTEYFFDEFGTHIRVTREFTTYLQVEEYPAASSYLEIVSYGWQNNYNVFPRTENATFQVTLANRAPFPMSGITLYLDLPENMLSRGGRTAIAYIEGPVRSLSTFTASFTITVGDVKPGKYSAKLTADFILQSGGPGARYTEKLGLNINVNDDSEAVEFVCASWQEGSVGPNTFGAHLAVYVRNNLVDLMKGAVLELNLPDGFVNAVDNSSIARVSPSIISPIIPMPQLQTQELSALLEEYLGTYQLAQTSQVRTYGRGDILTFTVPLHVLEVDPGIHNIGGNLSYIDQWGTKRSVKITIPVAILGRTAYVNIGMSGVIDVRSRFTNTSLTIENTGTSPLYDVDLSVLPYQQMPLLIVSPSRMYIERIDAGEKVNIPLTLAYNPYGFMTQVGGATVITYGPVPLTISIRYRDASGAEKSFSNMVTVIVEPFIDLLVRNIAAVSKNSSSTVSGVITNLGSATAYRVRVVFTIGNVSEWTLVGDIAPADEMAFRIDVPARGEIGVLRIEYRDAFNQQFSEEMTVRVEVQPEVQVTPPQERGLNIGAWIIIGAVIVFLAVAFILIYRVLRARSIKT